MTSPTPTDREPWVGHTPGPWAVFECGNWPGIETLNGDFSIVVFGDEGDEGGVRGRDDPEALANAALIAAAPQLAADNGRLRAAVSAAEEREKGLRKLIAGLNWFWRAEDREYSSSSPSEILEDADWGEIVEIDRGGVVETKFYFRLPPDDNGDSDDYFEGEFATLKEAKAALKAEQDRRAASPDPLATDAPVETVEAVDA